MSNAIEQVHDVLIIGGGPAGLAVASRLREPMPAASFTDEEQSRYQWIRMHADKMSVKNKKTGGVAPAKKSLYKTPSMLVLDASGDKWMSRWNALFDKFDISHLRSPMFFHIDPAERDGLLAYTHVNGRGKELREIGGCVGKEQSKHQRKKRERAGKQTSDPPIDERDRNDYFVPSKPLFSSHCDCLVKRYKLNQGVLRCEKVLDIRLGYFEEILPTEKIFSVQTDRGIHYARTVVLAVGPGNEPTIPGAPSCGRSEAMTHAMKIKEFPSERIQSKVAKKEKTNVIIVGGGTTSAQLADLAIRRGVSNVWLIMRGPLKIKPFDLSLEWVGKFKNFEQAAFWSADTDEERWEKIKTAKNGGSITPPYRKIVDRHVASGKLHLCLNTTIVSKDWNETSKTWKVQVDENGIKRTLPPMDHIYYATGVQTDVKSIPYLQSMLSDYPIPDCGGLPCITEDMQWDEGVPLFVTGRLGALQLGPGAPNLIGARIGAERISWNIQDILNGTKGWADKKPFDARFNYLTARGSRYDALATEDQ